VCIPHQDSRPALSNSTAPMPLMIPLPGRFTSERFTLSQPGGLTITQLKQIPAPPIIDYTHPHPQLEAMLQATPTTPVMPPEPAPTHTTTTARASSGDATCSDRQDRGLRRVVEYPNGDKYDGEWKDGNKHGHGMFTWADGRKYDGMWKDNKSHGRGQEVQPDGAKYLVEWENGRKRRRLG